MDLLKTFAEYASKDDAVEKAAFDAAMIEKLKVEPYKMSDLLYSLYRLQRDVEWLKEYVSIMREFVFETRPKVDEMDAPKTKAKKKKSHAKKPA